MFVYPSACHRPQSRSRRANSIPHAAYINLFHNHTLRAIIRHPAPQYTAARKHETRNPKLATNPRRKRSGALPSRHFRWILNAPDDILSPIVVIRMLLVIGFLVENVKIPKSKAPLQRPLKDRHAFLLIEKDNVWITSTNRELAETFAALVMRAILSPL